LVSLLVLLQAIMLGFIFSETEAIDEIKACAFCKTWNMNLEINVTFAPPLRTSSISQQKQMVLN
jgi:hypothetical protein